MPDVLVEERTCGACGIKVRPDTQYCYNCGESLESDGRDPGKGVATSPPEKGPAAPAPALIPNITSKDSAPNSPGRNGQAMPNTIVDGRPLQSAASLRRRGKAIERKTVEVVWEPAGSGTNIVLIIATVLFVLFAGVVVGLALYYR